MNKDEALALRKPFPTESVGKLPKGGVMLDYVGHAAVTDRLLTVDPEWSWEPFALDDHGLPALDRAGNLWIRLTICGTTRIGVGDGKSAKEAIGDAIRNAAMRFGVALDLWAKENLVEFAQASRAHQTSGPVEPAPDASPASNAPGPESDRITQAQQRKMRALLSEYGLGGKDQRDDVLALVSDVLGRTVGTSADLSRKEAGTVIEFLQLKTGELPEPVEPTDAGSADARLLAALGLTAAALWVCYLAPVVAALVFLPAALVSALVLVLLLRADRRDRAARDRNVVRSLARPLRPLTREQREAWERLRGQEWTT